MHWSAWFAIVVVAAWLTAVGRFIHTTDKLSAGKIAPPPRLLTGHFVLSLLVLGGAPVAIFIGIWGGVFWW